MFVLNTQNLHQKNPHGPNGVGFGNHNKDSQGERYDEYVRLYAKTHNPYFKDKDAVINNLIRPGLEYAGCKPTRMKKVISRMFQAHVEERTILEIDD